MENIRFYSGLKYGMELPPPEEPIQELPPPKHVILPFSDRPGIFCRPLVEKGELVFKGEKIGEDPHNRMAPVHSPVSGRVSDLRSYRFAEGGNTLSIFIESDGRDAWRSEHSPVEQYLEASPSKLIQMLRNAGVRIIPFEMLPGRDPSGFDEIPVRHFVINGIGQGFVGSISRRLIVERCTDLLKGIRLVRNIFRPEKIHLAINGQHHDVIQAIKESGLHAEAEVMELDVYYPLGHPHLLFKAIFNKEIPSPGGRAIDMGVLFSSVDTVIHGLEAVLYGKPLIERYITVSGDGIAEPKNLKALIGAPLSDLIDFCGGFRGTPGRLALGSPLDGMAQFALDRPVLKDTRWLWIQPAEQVIKEKYRACINCGGCVDVCPVGLMPNFLGKFCEFGKYDEAAEQYDLFTCIDCGLCAYVCPARRPMVQFINYGKREITQREKEHAAR